MKTALSVRLPLSAPEETGRHDKVKEVIDFAPARHPNALFYCCRELWAHLRFHRFDQWDSLVSAASVHLHEVQRSGPGCSQKSNISAAALPAVAALPVSPVDRLGTSRRTSCRPPTLLSPSNRKRCGSGAVAAALFKFSPSLIEACLRDGVSLFQPGQEPPPDSGSSLPTRIWSTPVQTHTEREVGDNGTELEQRWEEVCVTARLMVESLHVYLKYLSDVILHDFS